MAKKRISKVIENKILSYVNELKKDKLPINKVVLFGSYAKGTSNKYSDIDLCIVSPKFKDFVDDMQYLFIKRKDNTIPNIEPIGFNLKDYKQPSMLTKEIQNHGIEIKI